MSSFDEWYLKAGIHRNSFSHKDEEHWFKHNVRFAYKAGAQSRQAEIDCLTVELDGANERARMTLNHKNTMVEKKDREMTLLQEQVNELKQRIKFLEKELKTSNDAIKTKSTYKINWK